MERDPLQISEVPFSLHLFSPWYSVLKTTCHSLCSISTAQEVYWILPGFPFSAHSSGTAWSSNMQLLCVIHLLFFCLLGITVYRFRRSSVLKIIISWTLFLCCHFTWEGKCNPRYSILVRSMKKKKYIYIAFWLFLIMPTYVNILLKA